MNIKVPKVFIQSREEKHVFYAAGISDRTGYKTKWRVKIGSWLRHYIVAKRLETCGPENLVLK